MNEQECLSRMVAPGTPRQGKWRGGVIQIHVTRLCDKSCFNCTQGSNLSGPTPHMTPDQFARAVESLRGYFGVVGVFGGNPATSPHFVDYCRILRESWVPHEQRGLWCNNLINATKARAARETFNPAVSNLNVHLDKRDYDLFKKHWPESNVFGLNQDSRHSPVYVAMKDVVRKTCSKCEGMGDIYWPSEDGGSPRLQCEECGGKGTVLDESRIWELISGCDINQHWSAMIGVFRGELRAWFCEVAGAQAMLHQDEPDYPDTGLNPNEKHVKLTGAWPGSERRWWELGMTQFADQVRKHCFDCGVPLRGYGELAQAEPKDPNGPRPWDAQKGVYITDEELKAWKESCQPKEQVSQTHANVYQPKRSGRRVEVVTKLEQLGMGRLKTSTHYLQNAKV